MASGRREVYYVRVFDNVGVLVDCGVMNTKVSTLHGQISRSSKLHCKFTRCYVAVQREYFANPDESLLFVVTGTLAVFH